MDRHCLGSVRSSEAQDKAVQSRDLGATVKKTVLALKPVQGFNNKDRNERRGTECLKSVFLQSHSHFNHEQRGNTGQSLSQTRNNTE